MSAFTKQTKVHRNHPECVAMRRIVAEQGRWLSPLLADHPVPVLTEWEATVDLAELHARIQAKSNAGKAHKTPAGLSRSIERIVVVDTGRVRVDGRGV